MTQHDGAMTQRLQQLTEDSLQYDRTALHEKLSQIANRQENFDYVHQHAVSVTKIPSGADKLAREVAASKPWTGTESTYDASLRMLNDSVKPLKVKAVKRGMVRNRMHAAKEGALDYRLAKVSESKNVKDEEDDDGWSEMYRERLLGPAMLVNDSFASVDNSIRSLADQRIQEAKRRGEFKNIKRGEPMKEGFHALENRFIDRTEYHLNSILKRQDALPPWIERQGGCQLQIQRFREELEREWTQWAVNHVKDEYPGMEVDGLVGIMEKYVQSESVDSNGVSKLRSKKWLETRKPYFEVKIRELNDSIRGYNLQAPLASQKMYLLLDKELEKCYKNSAPYLVDALKRHISSEKEMKVKKASAVCGSIPQRENVHQRKTESLFSMFKSLF